MSTLITSALKLQMNSWSVTGSILWSGTAIFRALACFGKELIAEPS